MRLWRKVALIALAVSAGLCLIALLIAMLRIGDTVSTILFYDVSLAGIILSSALLALLWLASRVRQSRY